MDTLDIFRHRFGDGVITPEMRANTDNAYGEVALRMLDCVQTVVDVLADEVNKGYTVSFAPTPSAVTMHQTKSIVISVLPLAEAKPGDSLLDIAAVLTGFAVHEVGHTKRVGIIDAARTKWPGKMLPKTLANAIEDNVLEARVIERFAGFREVFVPTLRWVARATCPTGELAYGGTTGERVNFAGQVLRYRNETKFNLADQRTADAVEFFDSIREANVATLTPAQGLALVEDMLAYIHKDPEPKAPEPDEGGCQIGGEGIPDEEPDEPTTEGGNQPGKGKGKPDGDDTEGEDGDDEPGGTEGDGDSDSDDDSDDDDGDTEGGDDGDDEGGDGTEGGGDGDDTEGGDPDGDGDGEGRDGDGNDADTLDRGRAPKGTNSGDGAGGKGQSVSEAADPDEGLDVTELRKEWDELNERRTHEDIVAQNAVDEERKTTRLNGGTHGKMRVIWD